MSFGKEKEVQNIRLFYENFLWADKMANTLKNELMRTTIESVNLWRIKIICFKIFESLKFLYCLSYQILLDSIKFGLKFSSSLESSDFSSQFFILIEVCSAEHGEPNTNSMGSTLLAITTNLFLLSSTGLVMWLRPNLRWKGLEFPIVFSE